jgi:hypothetical protein
MILAVFCLMYSLFEFPARSLPGLCFQTELQVKCHRHNIKDINVTGALYL